MASILAFFLLFADAQVGITPIFPFNEEVLVDLAKEGLQIVFPGVQIEEKKGDLLLDESLAQKWLELSTVLPKQIFNPSNENSPLYKRDP